jgi:long-chain acyl-CoA synthetase
MLYDRWRQVLAQRRAELALADLRTGLRYTFEQLDAAASSTQPGRPDIQYSQDHGMEFIVAVLAAWRQHSVICPVESAQKAPTFKDLPADCVHLKLTSASTGTARAVAFTGEQLTADAENIVSTMGLRPEWPNIGVISLAHSYGFSNLVLPLLLHGIPLCLTAPLPESLRHATTSVGQSTVAAVPALWRTWHEAGVIPDTIRLGISAGAPLPVALENAIFCNAGLKIHNFYGATECGGIAYDATDTPRSDNRAVGRALQNVTVCGDQDGCLLVRSKAVGLAYWPDPEAALRDGCFKTSDLVDLNAGEIVLRGRLGDQINVAGRKVSPEVIEEALRADPRVRDCVVFGVPNGQTGRGEIIVACVAGTQIATAEPLRSSLAEKLAPWQIPREWLFLDALPVNERGKLSRAEWRQRYIMAVSSNQ